MDKITYEPITDHFPSQITAEDLHNLIEKLRPLLDAQDPLTKVIQIENN